MRILHTADWHLGRVFHGLSLLEDQAVLLKQVRQIAREEKADVLVMAGDVYDRGLPPTDAVELLDETLSAFALDLQIPVLLIAGNHDNAKRLEYGKALFAGRNIHFFGSVGATAPDPVVVPDLLGGDVYFCPLPFCDPLTASQASGASIKDFEAVLRWQRDRILTKVPAARARSPWPTPSSRGRGNPPTANGPWPSGARRMWVSPCSSPSSTRPWAICTPSSTWGPRQPTAAPS